MALAGTVFSTVESAASDPTRALQFGVLGKTWHLVSAALSKISICLFLFARLLGRARQWRILPGLLALAVAAVDFAFVLAVNLQCRPLEKVWRPLVAGQCWDPGIQISFGYAQGGQFSVLDLQLASVADEPSVFRLLLGLPRALLRPDRAGHLPRQRRNLALLHHLRPEPGVGLLHSLPPLIFHRLND